MKERDEPPPLSSPVVTGEESAIPILPNQPPYAEIAVTSNFSFLRGASRPEELVAQAYAYNYAAIGIADRNTLAGVVRAYAALGDPRFTETKPKLLIGTRLVFADDTPEILAYPTDRRAYGNLRLLSEGKLRVPAGEKRATKGECTLFLGDLLAWQDGLLLVVMPPARGALTKAKTALETLRAAAPDRGLAGGLHALSRATTKGASTGSPLSRARFASPCSR
ncbi:MAG: PHP domain-containing protein [Rhizomicrobium sp.]